MKAILTLGLSAILCLALQAQKYDYRWILGYVDWPNTDVVFTSTAADTMTTYRHAEMDNSQTTISDSAGNLLFYTNGAKIFTPDNSIMQNGDSINFGEEWISEGGYSYDWLEDVIGLPTDSPNIWNLLHYYVEDNANSYLLEYPWRIDQTRLNMSLDSGQGAVLFKNKTIIQDTLGTYVTACRHANGRDWWLLASKISSNCLYELLIQPDTIINCGMQCLGDTYVGGDAGQAAFSPDGSKFAWCGGLSGVNLYDFDRCSGLLSNAVHFPLYWNPDSNSQYGLSFSPNSRFMYIAQSLYIIQFDMDSNDILASMDTVGFYSQPPDTDVLPGYFFLMQLGADGKIYISSSNGIKYLHVINNPDGKGDSCNFVNYGFPLPNFNSFGLPSYPNYRLGALPGSPCDTIYKTDTSGVNIFSLKENILKIFPNPATDYTIIDYGFTDWSKGETSLQVINELGQTVWQQALPMYSGFQHLDISKYASGMYEALIKRSGSIVAEGKFVKQ